VSVMPRREPAFEAESEAYSLFQRGVAFLREQHPAQAAMLLAQALRLEPGKSSIREALGRAEFALGMYQHAAERFRDAVGDAPDNDYAHYARGRCLLELGCADEARAHLRLARALRPQSDLYREALSALD
jgi:Flp pilus assembly protein TadD